MLLARIAILVVALVVGALPALAQQRLALLITNQNYVQPGAKLENTHADGDLIKAALEKVGFRVTVVRDTKSEGELLKAIGDHVQRLTDAGPEAVGFFYYSGHGAADRPDGANYLIPTEAPLTHVNQLPLMALRLDKITSTLANVAKMSFVVFDACRNVALARDGKDFGFKGFAPIREQRGLLVAYATEPGNVAIDQSLYAQALAVEILQPGAEAGQVFRSVAQRVEASTGGRQSPEFLDRRRHDFRFVNATPPPIDRARSVDAQCDGVRLSFDKTLGMCVKPGSGFGFRDCPQCPEMTVVPAGQYLMGASDAEIAEMDAEAEREWANKGQRHSVIGPQRLVTIGRPFAVGRYEVSFAEWDICADDGSCTRPFNHNYALRGPLPVFNVSWSQVVNEYLPWLSRRTGHNYRLLSEAEWEYAARAGTTSRFAFGETIDTHQARFISSLVTAFTNAGPAARGSYQPNRWGLYDVHGNILEMVQDCYSAGYVGVPTDGSPFASPDCMQRVARGGSHLNNVARFLRSSYRFHTKHDDKGHFLGFRVARDID